MNLTMQKEFVESMEGIIGALRGCLPRPGVVSQGLIELVKQAEDRAQGMESCCQRLRDEVESKREDVEANTQETKLLASTRRDVDIGSVFEDF